MLKILSNIVESSSITSYDKKYLIFKPKFVSKIRNREYSLFVMLHSIELCYNPLWKLVIETHTWVGQRMN